MSERPTLLMISHCVPDALGNGDQQQAWRLLCKAGQTYRVSLICLMGAPLRLMQWRAAFSRTDRMVILNRGLMGRATGEPGSQVAETIAMWRAEGTSDAVLATHPKLWRQAELSGASMRICDFTSAESGRHRRRLAEAPGGLIGWVVRTWRRRLSAIHDIHERSVARQCDTIIVSNFDELRQYGTEPCHIVVTIDALDLGANAPAGSIHRPLTRAA